MRKIFFLFFILFSFTAEAANYAIRPDCPNNGNGTSWSCAGSPGGAGAYNAIPSSLSRGSTYYFGDGTISQSYELDDANSSTTYIYFKKATSSDYGSLSGWDSSYGDGQTVFHSTDTYQGTIFYYAYDSTNGYYSFDGAKGAGSLDPADYGFLFEQTVAALSGGDCFLIFNGYNGSATGQTIKNSAFVTLGAGDGTVCQQPVYGGNATLIQGNLFKNADNPVFNIGGSSTVENNIFTGHWSSDPYCHGQQVTTQGSNLDCQKQRVYGWYRERGNIKPVYKYFCS